jgi:hypothetical protein
VTTDRNDLPKLPAPAQRALTAAGYQRLDQLSGVSEGALKRLHGMGPNAVKVISDALAERGLSLAD